MATDAQKRFGSVPIHPNGGGMIAKPRGKNNRVLTECELDCGMTPEQLRERQQEMRLAALKRYGITPTEDAA